MNKYERHAIIVNQEGSYIGRETYNYFCQLLGPPIDEDTSVSSTFGHEWRYRFTNGYDEVILVDAMNSERSMVQIDFKKGTDLNPSECMQRLHEILRK